MQKNKKGFTLIELLLVISIISFLSSVVLVSVKVARDKAVTAKITEDLRQVRIALELNYGDTGQYDIISVKNGSNVINKALFNVYDRNLFIKRVHAQSLVQSIPQACTLFNQIAQELVDKKYLNSIPVHPRQDYSQGICYKAVKSEDNASLAVYAETPARTGLTVSSPAKNVGFVTGNTNIENLENIRSRSIEQGGGTGYLQTINNQTITNISQIADEVIGMTRGVPANYTSLNDLFIDFLNNDTPIMINNTNSHVTDPNIITTSSNNSSSSSSGTYTPGTIVGSIDACGSWGSVLLSNGVCEVSSSGCHTGDTGPCIYYLEPQYSCPPDSSFLINGSEYTINGTCVTY